MTTRAETYYPLIDSCQSIDETYAVANEITRETLGRLPASECWKLDVRGQQRRAALRGAGMAVVADEAPFELSGPEREPVLYPYQSKDGRPVLPNRALRRLLTALSWAAILFWLWWALA